MNTQEDRLALAAPLGRPIMTPTADGGPGGDPLAMHPKLQGLLDYWQRRRGDRAMPARRDIDPTDIPTLLANVLVTEIVDPALPPGRHRHPRHGGGRGDRQAARRDPRAGAVFRLSGVDPQGRRAGGAAAVHPHRRDHPGGRDPAHHRPAGDAAVERRHDGRCADRRDVSRRRPGLAAGGDGRAGDGLRGDRPPLPVSAAPAGRGPSTVARRQSISPSHQAAVSTGRPAGSTAWLQNPMPVQLAGDAQDAP
ncbi:MAG: PAS domain-containing protein [Alphaproteobacteria bacterium]|nr:PAS domain-containing protein [Alphaproteobacteria bacterium]